MLFLLISGCTVHGSLSAGPGNLAVSSLEKDDPDKSYGEIVLEKISGGNYKRRLLGWIDRTS